MKNSRGLPLKYRIEPIIARVMGYLPVSWASAIGAAIGELAARRAIRSNTPGVVRFYKNIKKLKGISSTEALRKLMIEYGRQTGRLYAEFPVIQKIDRQGHITIEGRENLGDLYETVIFVTPHMSNCELVGKALTLKKNSGCALVDPVEGEARARLADKVRLSWREDASVIHSDAPMAMKLMIKKLSAGINVLLFTDEGDEDYVWGPSLGRKIPYGGNRWVAARLAVRQNIDVIPVCVQRFNSIDFKIIIGKRISVPTGGNRDSKAKYVADRIDDRLDSWVRNKPEHWLLITMLDFDKEMPDRLK